MYQVKENPVNSGFRFPIGKFFCAKKLATVYGRFFQLLDFGFTHFQFCQWLKFSDYVNSWKLARSAQRAGVEICEANTTRNLVQHVAKHN
jgi:hypothetical protein